MAGESRGTVLVALGANAVIAVVKFAAGAMTGSAALFSEGAHSIADTLNEGFLLASLKRSQRPADAEHPFGYGKERFFWSLLAAVGIFVAGAGFSAVEAYRSFTHHETVSGHYFLVAYVALGLAGLAEGTSWARALRQLRREAAQAGRGLVEHVRTSSDPSVTTVASEDSAALLGLALAAGGVALHQVTGQGWWEGVASAAIAVLLVVVAVGLGRDSESLLIGEAADPRVRDGIRGYLDGHPAVDRVVDLLTMRIGAGEALVAARIDLVDDLGSADVERVSTEIDREISRRWPGVRQVFLDATRADERPVRAPTAAPRGG